MRPFSPSIAANVIGRPRALALPTVWVRAAIANYLLATMDSCVFYVRGDLNVTLSGAVMATWGDQSGNGRDVTGAGAARPTFTQRAINGKPGGTGDGTDDIMSSANTNPIGNGAYTAIGAWKNATAAASKYFLEYGTGSLGSGFDIGTEAGSVRGVGHSGVAAHNDAAISSNAEVWYARRGAAAAPTLQVDGTDQALTNSGTTGMNDPGATAKISLFASAFPTAWVQGSIAEVSLHAAALPVIQCTRAMAHLRNRYGT